MSDTINTENVQVARGYITDRETYLRLKFIQTNIPNVLHGKADEETINKIPNYFYKDLWNEAKYRRALNIIYGIIKGKSYSKIEQKVHEGNEISEITWWISKVLTEFKIDAVKFNAALGAQRG